MAHRQRGEPEGPGDADRQHNLGDDRVVERPEADDHQHGHADERDGRGTHHGPLRLAHFVVFEDGDARQPERNARVFGRFLADQFAEVVDRAGRAAEIVVLEDRLGLDEAHRPFGVEERAQSRLEFGEGGVGADEFGPGGDEIGLILQEQIEAAGQAVDLLEQRFEIRGQFFRGEPFDGVGLFDALAEIANHLADRQQPKPVTTQERAVLAQLIQDFLELIGVQVLQALLPQFLRIDLVEDAAEVGGVLFGGPAQIEHGVADRLAVGAFDDDDDVRGVAKLVDVGEPAALVVDLGADEIGPAGFELQTGRGEVAGGDREADAEREGGPGSAEHEFRQRAERERHDAARFTL